MKILIIFFIIEQVGFATLALENDKLVSKGDSISSEQMKSIKKSYSNGIVSPDPAVCPTPTQGVTQASQVNSMPSFFGSNGVADTNIGITPGVPTTQALDQTFINTPINRNDNIITFGDQTLGPAQIAQDKEIKNALDKFIDGSQGVPPQLKALSFVEDGKTADVLKTKDPKEANIKLTENLKKKLEQGAKVSNADLATIAPTNATICQDALSCYMSGGNPNMNNLYNYLNTMRNPVTGQLPQGATQIINPYGGIASFGGTGMMANIQQNWTANQELQRYEQQMTGLDSQVQNAQNQLSQFQNAQNRANETHTQLPANYQQQLQYWQQQLSSLQGEKTNLQNQITNQRQLASQETTTNNRQTQLATAATRQAVVKNYQEAQNRLLNYKSAYAQNTQSLSNLQGELAGLASQMAALGPYQGSNIQFDGYSGGGDLGSTIASGLMAYENGKQLKEATKYNKKLSKKITRLNEMIIQKRTELQAAWTNQRTLANQVTQSQQELYFTGIANSYFGNNGFGFKLLDLLISTAYAAPNFSEIKAKQVEFVKKLIKDLTEKELSNKKYWMEFYNKLEKSDRPAPINYQAIINLGTKLTNSAIQAKIYLKQTQEAKNKTKDLDALRYLELQEVMYSRYYERTIQTAKKQIDLTKDYVLYDSFKFLSDMNYAALMDGLNK